MATSSRIDAISNGSRYCPIKGLTDQLSIARHAKHGWQPALLRLRPGRSESLPRHSTNANSPMRSRPS